MVKVGFIGFGRMGSVLAEGAVSSRCLKASQVLVYDTERAPRLLAKKKKFRTTESIRELVSASTHIFLCVKPQQMDDVVREASEVLSKKSPKKCFISIAAGIPIERLEKGLGKNVSILRVMPNTPALLNAGMAAVSRGSRASVQQEKWLKKILGSVGSVISVPERLMDAVTAVSGSGPAYVFYLAESMMAAAKNLGLKPAFARELVHQTIYGAGQMLKKRPEEAEELRRQVTSPKGTTAAALAEFEKLDFKLIVMKALSKAAQRSAELARI